jgi:hypothetical protein
MARRKRGAPEKSEKQQEIDKRRVQVATLLVSGRKQRDIAAALSVSLGTVNGDVKAVLKLWQESALNDMAAAMALDLERVETIIRSIWLQVTGGNLNAIDRAERMIRLRKEIIGYGYRPDANAVDPNWQPITVIEVVKDYGPTTIDGESTVLDDGLPSLEMKPDA